MRNNFAGIQEAKASDMPTHNSVDYPGEYIELPSKGKFYPKDHPLYNKQVIKLKYITPREENILNNKLLIQNGTIFDVLLRNIILEPDGVDPLTILSADKTAMIFQARILSYGPNYDPKMFCPNCKHAQVLQYNLANYVAEGGDEILERAKENNISYDEEKQEFLLPIEENLTVGCRLLTSKDIEETKEDEIVTSLYSKIITSINGNYDPTYVKEQYENFPYKISKKLRRLYKEITPKILCFKDFECSSCGWIIPDVEVPLTAEFFWSE